MLLLPQSALHLRVISLLPIIRRDGMKFWSLFFFIGYLAHAQTNPSQSSQSQILDDSTKQVYGPLTTRYLLEADLLKDRDTTYAVDTAMDNFHNYNFVNRFGNRYADLGNLGTPLRPVFYTPPTQIGTYPGLNAYTPYAFGPDEVKYYDTKSPYTSLKYVQGGRFQQLLEVSHSRNVNPRWNFGLDYQRLTSAKQFGYQGRQGREERHADHHSVVVYTRWLSKDSAYHVLAHFSHLNHTLNDQGGLLEALALNRQQDSLLTDFDLNGRSQLAPGQSNQQQVRSQDFRNQLHLYHQYKFGNGFQVYHIFDRQTQRYSYQDLQPRYPDFALLRGGRNFYPDRFPNDTTRTYYYSDDATQDQTRFVLYENKVGLKGTFRGWDYRLYARRRDFSISYGQSPINPYTIPTNTVYEPVTVRRAENFLGAWGQYRFSKRIKLYAEGEYLLFRDYRLSGTFESPWFRAGYLSMLHSPTLVQQRMSGNHFRWDNAFSAVSMNQLFGQLNLRVGKLYFEPQVSLTNLANYIYFDVAAAPRQSTPFQIIQLGGTLAYHGKVFHAINQVHFTQVTTGADVLRIPQLFANARWYLEGPLFRKALYLQIGVDVHYKSTYFADAYMPATGQFHLQNEFAVNAYPVVDAFVNARINRVRLFAKFAHANQGFPGNGYFTAPYYPGQRRTFGFGVLWPLFD